MGEPEFRGLIVPGLPTQPPPPQNAEEMYALIRKVWDQFAQTEPVKVVMSQADWLVAGAYDVAPGVMYPGSPRTVIYGLPVEIDDTAESPRLESVQPPDQHRHDNAPPADGATNDRLRRDGG